MYVNPRLRALLLKRHLGPHRRLPRHRLSNLANHPRSTRHRLRNRALELGRESRDVSGGCIRVNRDGRVHTLAPDVEHLKLDLQRIHDLVGTCWLLAVLIQVVLMLVLDIFQLMLEHVCALDIERLHDQGVFDFRLFFQKSLIVFGNLSFIP